MSVNTNVDMKYVWYERTMMLRNDVEEQRKGILCGGGI